MINLKNKQDVLEKYPELYIDVEKYKTDSEWICGVFRKDTLKSNKQTNLFHSLLNVYWLSGCSSFETYDDLRLHYKDFAGLVLNENKSNLKSFTKECLWKAIKLLPIDNLERQKIIGYLKGTQTIILSWSEITKEKATECIKKIINDMDESNVLASSQGSKYEFILKEIHLWFENI